MDDFFSLTPDSVLGAVEDALGGGARATGRCFAHSSLENRVYEIELEDRDENTRRVVAKFYRPGRWSRAALGEEHGFLRELGEAELPVVEPLVLASGDTLAQTGSGILFAVFPKTAGRALHELDDDQLLQVGRLLARLHTVGESRAFCHRPQLTPRAYGLPALELLLSRGVIDVQVAGRYERAAREILARIEPLWDGVPLIRLHGDCHQGNLLWQARGPFFLDFDDTLSGPAAQDLWMVVRGRDPEALRQRALLAEGYEQMRALDRRWVRHVEPLRALRLIHYAAWIARRAADPIFQRTFPEFTTYQYWAEETVALEEQLLLIRDAAASDLALN